MMKRRVNAWVLALVMMAALLSAPEVAHAASFTAGKAAIKFSGTTYKLGSTSTTFKKKLGKYTRKKYDACTYGDYSYMYKFNGIRVETAYSKAKKKETIISFVITSSRVPTAAGLKVGHRVSKMESLYGKKYKKSGSKYTYTSGKCIMEVKVNSKTKKISTITMLKL